MYHTIEKLTNKQGLSYLYKTVCVYDKKTKKVLKKRQPLGRLDELQKIYPDPIDHFKKLYKDEFEAVKHTQLEQKSISFDTLNNPDLYDTINTDDKNVLNLGCIFFSKLYHSLNFEYLFKKIKYKEKTKLPLSKILQLLIFARIMNPSSKLKDFKFKDNYAEIFNFSSGDVYKSLDIFHKHKTLFLEEIKQNISNFVSYDFSKVHYDVTNYYVYTSTKDDEALVQKGYSKINNHCPIVQMALSTDKNGLPIDYKLFSGNTPDVSTYIDFIKESTSTYPIRKGIIVADAGLVSNDNIVTTILNGAGFIFKHSILKFNKDEYNMFKNTIKPMMEAVLEENPNLNALCKSVVVPVTRTVKDIKGNTKKVQLNQKYLFIYSKKFDEKHKHIRMEEIELADKYIKNNKKLKDKINKLSSSLLKIKNIEVKLDEEKLEKYENVSGYSVIISSELDTDDSEIINAYRNQYLIEESFKITKTDIKSRPIFLSKDEHIKSHFFVCFLALLFLRIINIGLNREVSIDEIKENVKNFNIVTITNSNIYEIINYNETIDKIRKFLGVEFGKKMITGADIRKLFGNVKKI